ncbi:MAG: patatin-like phospholipase family protein [Saprospiraceae bacterium]
MRIFFRQLFFSFPVRLLALHFQKHLTLLALWLMLAMLTTGKWGHFFGIFNLLLLPEYYGLVNFWSYFITGAAFGILFMVWQLTTYLLIAHRFPFLATLKKPFTKFALNNSLIPLIYLVVYLSSTIWLQQHDELSSPGTALLNASGFLSGMVFLMLFLTAYLHFTNKDIGAFLTPANLLPKAGNILFAPGERRPSMRDIRRGLTRWRVDNYLTEKLHVRQVRSVAHYNPKLLSKVFEQNHTNAFVVHFIILSLLIGLGLFMDNSWARIPAGATIFILCSLFMAIFGAIVFWFRSWGALVFIFMVYIINLTTGLGFFNYRNRAYGLDYRTENRAKYSYDELEKMASPEQVEADKKNTLNILENWLQKNKAAGTDKPKLVVLCVSGGGMRSAVWTMHTLQQADRATGGKLLQQTTLITGASGGMLGAAYLRELALQKQEGQAISLYDTTFTANIGKDLLNPVCFSIVSNDIFYPSRTFRSGNFTYRKDRGYMLERQLNENCQGILGKRLADYRQPEEKGLIPMMVLSPYILNDARKLLISPHGVSYLMQPPAPPESRLQTEIDGVDFRALFARQEADSLAFTTALRMNSTFPLILPNVMLPTHPIIEAVDAGFRDNYGLTTAQRFIQVFAPWIKKHTSGVLLVEIRCWEKFEPIPEHDHKGSLENLFVPLNAASRMTTMQDYQHDEELSMLNEILGSEHFQVLRFIYRPAKKENEASMSFHLSAREKRDLVASFYLNGNQKQLRLLKEALEE